MANSSITMANSSITDDVKEYYGKTLQSSNDLKTNACTVGSVKIPKHIREALSLISEEVDSRYYGCGLVAPELLEGCSILDLGSGSGRDCFVLSKLVGEGGHVTGLDMTTEQLDVARRNVAYHTETFGYKEPNVNFVHGYMEKLDEAGLKDDTYDVIISNCVINLSPDKRAVIQEAHRVLKAGGELYFSDVYADRQLSDEIRKNKVLWGECIAGAMYWVDFMNLAKECGFGQPRLVSATNMTIDNPTLEAAVGDAKFVSATYRVFKLPSAGKSTVGRNVIYEGSIPECDAVFNMDYGTQFQTEDVVWTEPELSTILSCSRFKRVFSFEPINKMNKPACLPAKTKIDDDPFAVAAGNGSSGGGCCPTTSKCC